MSDVLNTPITYLKGVGPQRAEALQKELHIFTYGDLLHHFPFRYINRLQINHCNEIHFADGYIQLIGFIDGIQEFGVGRNKKLQCRFTDDTGTIQLIWFQGWKWIKPQLMSGKKYRVFGRPKLVGNHWTVPHPEISPADESLSYGFQPIYHSTEKLSNLGLHTKGIEKLMKTMFESIVLDSQILPDILPNRIRQQYVLTEICESLKGIHFPENENDFSQAQYRLKFEELFLLQLEMILRKGIRKKNEKGFIFETAGELLHNFFHDYLPYELTSAQKRVIKEIRKDFLTGRHMNRLLQGDVGSGKTLVALITMLIAIGNGYQAAFLAPTEILAFQHAATIKEFVKDLPLTVDILTGSTKKAKRTPLLKDLMEGTIQLLIGTHALLEETVQFKNLGLVIIDEQHRFGVAQRAKMRTKNLLPPHVLVMTATPIPRTLAMTFYGDLDVSTIDELPPGRNPIQTIHKYDAHRHDMYEFLRNQIHLGRQIYIVYPLIEESETLDFKSLTEGFETISSQFPQPEFQISMVHGKLKPDEKEKEMQRFVNGETQIMVATTVIEVGVNVPNASVMVIESSQRFGLSQLHQLRGRVGRGSAKSYCILMTPYELSKEAKKRVKTMVETTDGFKISEVDLELRGPGDLLGTQQSGALEFKLADLSKDQSIVIQARECAESLFTLDPRLEEKEHYLLKQKMLSALKNKPQWDKIA